MTCKGLLGRPLRVGVVSWPGYAGGIVANNGFKPNQDSLYYQQHKLCVEFLLMEDIDARGKAFVKGGKDGVDIVWSTVDFWANELPGFVKGGVEARAVMQVDWSRGGDAIVVDDSINRVEDLYQKKISLALFTPSHWLLESSLQHSSLDESQQAEIVRSLIGKNASPDARADFVARRVDAAVVWEPDVAEALQQRPGSHVLVSTKQASKLIADVMVAREDFIQAHRDVIQAFVEGWVMDGTVKANREPDTVVKLLMENEPIYKELGAEGTRKSLSTVEWADLADNVEMFNLDGRDTDNSLFDSIFKNAGERWIARGYIGSAVPATVAKDDSFLRNIYQRNPVGRKTPVVLPAPPSMSGQAPISVQQVTVNFASGSAKLNEAARKILDEQVGLLPRTFAGAYIRVEGNTDNVGRPEVNRPLSLRRANAVIRYLVEKHNLPLAQFVPIGNGPDHPIASNDTDDGRAKNRRTDFGVLPRS